VIGRRASRAELCAGIVVAIGIDLLRQADPQRVGRKLTLVELDAHRQALDDLDPVARGVLRRQHGEGAARAG
jgi:hypothetical protein